MLNWSGVVLVAVVIPVALAYCLYRFLWWYVEEHRVRLFWRYVTMGRWVTTAQPAAALTREDDATEQLDDGTKIFYYHTTNGVRFAERVEPTGFVLWLQFRE